MLPKFILWKQRYCIWIEKHEEAILLFVFLQMFLTLQIILYMDKYHYSANLRCYSCVNFSSGGGGGGSSGGGGGGKSTVFSNDFFS